MKLWMSLIKTLLFVATLCELHNTTCEVYATISNRSSSYNNSFSHARSHVEQAKQAAGIYHSRNYPTNKIHQQYSTEPNCQVKVISAQEYAAMVSGSNWLQQEQAQQKQIKDTFAEQLSKLENITKDTQELLALYQEYDSEKHTYLEKRLIALKDVQTGAISYAVQSYHLNTNVIDILHAHAINKENFTTVYGNKLQQVMHQECITILERIVNLSIDSPLYDYKSTLVECVESARTFNQYGSVDKAIKITNFCWSLLDYSKAIIEGITAGVIGAIQNV